MKIEEDTIRGVQEDEQVLCPKCYLKFHPDFAEVTYEQFVKTDELDKDERTIWFCDSCKNQL